MRFSYLNRATTSLALLSILFAASKVAAQQKPTCQALVLSGGANKGAYEAGVIYGMAHILPEDQVRWDVLSGVSAGALNCGGVSVWPVD